MQKKVLLIINPNAGIKKITTTIFGVLKAFSDKGFAADVRLTLGRGDGTRYVLEEGANYSLIVCSGGDGTFSEVLNGVMRLKNAPALGYIPAGSTNDLAGSLGLSTSNYEAAERIACGAEHSIDAGLFNERYFSYIASFGAFTEVSYNTPQNIKNALGHLAYVLSGVKELPNIRPYHLRVETESGIFEDDYIFGAVSNSTSIAGIVKLDSGIVDLNDGLFEVMLVKYPQNAADLNKIIISVTTQEYNEDVITFFHAKELVLHTDGEMPWTIDGEYEAAGKTVFVKNVHDAYRIIF